jgi:hypothetical protein
MQIFGCFSLFQMVKTSFYFMVFFLAAHQTKKAESLTLVTCDGQLTLFITKLLIENPNLNPDLR